VKFWKTRFVGADTFGGLSATAWTGVTALLTAGLLLTAVVAAIYAKRQWDIARAQIAEGRAAELEARRPYVIVTIEPSDSSRVLFDLVVRNIGQRPAVSVSIGLDPPPVRAREEDGFEIANAKMLTEPVAMIAPGQEMRTFYDSHFERAGRDDLPALHRVELSYQDSSGHKYAETGVIDINAMMGTIYHTVKTVSDIGESLEKIQETLKDASVLARQGTLAVEASIEPRAEQQERLASERAEARRNWDERVRKLMPSGPDADKGSESAPITFDLPLRLGASRPHHEADPNPDGAAPGAAQEEGATPSPPAPDKPREFPRG
jgi:hypothetical protein